MKYFYWVISEEEWEITKKKNESIFDELYDDNDDNLDEFEKWKKSYIKPRKMRIIDYWEI